MKTIGISPKAVLAFVFPLVAAVVGSLSSWAIGGFGAFDTTSVVIAATGLGASGVALLGAYVGKPGNVTPITPAPAQDVADRPVPAQRDYGLKMRAIDGPRPAMSSTISRPESAPTVEEEEAPFDPDGERVTVGDFASYPVESFVADRTDKHGADDLPVVSA